jgi:hypothetical protein
MKRISHSAGKARAASFGESLGRNASSINGGKWCARIVLLLAAGCLTGHTQNTASLYLSGTMPPIQHLEIINAQSITATNNQLTVALNTRANIADGYSITLERQAPIGSQGLRAGTNELTYNGRQFALPTGSSIVLPPSADAQQKHGGILQISPPVAGANQTFVLSIKSQ